MNRRDRWSKDGLTKEARWLNHETNTDALRAVARMLPSVFMATPQQRIGLELCVARARRRLRKMRRYCLARNQFTPLKRRVTYRRPR